MNAAAQPIAPLAARRTIRKKLLVSMIGLGIVVAILGYSGVQGVYAFRNVAATLSARAAELPITGELMRHVDEMRYAFHRLNDDSMPLDIDAIRNTWSERQKYRFALQSARETLSRYQTRLALNAADEPYLADSSREREMVKRIASLLDAIADRYRVDDLLIGAGNASLQESDLAELSDEVHELPTLLQNRMASFRQQVRTQYRMWIVLVWISFAIAAILVASVIAYARIAVIRPFKTLLTGARRIAAADFEYRIELDSRDELAELASVINHGTAEFLRIQTNLNQQVLERSREVIRNEQLASVGFLAAGVAHEINNPLASIAWSAEALESRLHKLLAPVAAAGGQDMPEVQTLQTYLRRIQDEAFRCKGITERLLDFSRLSQIERKQATDLREVVSDVIEMVRHLGQYRGRRIDFIAGDLELAWASPQEMKQVVLNLLTNSLDALLPDREDQRVNVQLSGSHNWVTLRIEDNGCGMTDEVRQHLFEPFFTRRRDGRGTGLGLPITSRIIADHGGSITASSRGENLGSRFEVSIPTAIAVANNQTLGGAVATQSSWNTVHSATNAGQPGTQPDMLDGADAWSVPLQIDQNSPSSQDDAHESRSRAA